MKFIHTSQKYRPQTALFGRQWIIEVGRMDSKSGLGSAGDREMCAFNLARYRASLSFLRSFWRILIVRVPNVRSCTILACFNTCDRIVQKRREILSHTSVFKFEI